LRRIIYVFKESNDPSERFKIYFYPDTNIVVSKSGPVDLLYRPEADVKTMIIFKGKEYPLDSSEFTVLLNHKNVKAPNRNSKQDESVDSI